MRRKESGGPLLGEGSGFSHFPLIFLNNKIFFLRKNSVGIYETYLVISVLNISRHSTYRLERVSPPTSVNPLGCRVTRVIRGFPGTSRAFGSALAIQEEWLQLLDLLPCSACINHYSQVTGWSNEPVRNKWPTDWRTVSMLAQNMAKRERRGKHHVGG